MIDRHKVPIGLVLDYFGGPGADPLRVRVKGFRPDSGNRLSRDQGLIYLVSANGGREEVLPPDITDPTVAMFWQLVDDGDLRIVGNPDD